MRALIFGLLASLAGSVSAQSSPTGWSIPETVWINLERRGNAPEVVLLREVPTVAFYQKKLQPDDSDEPVALLMVA